METGFAFVFEERKVHRLPGIAAPRTPRDGGRRCHARGPRRTRAATWPAQRQRTPAARRPAIPACGSGPVRRTGRAVDDAARAGQEGFNWQVLAELCETIHEVEIGRAHV